MAFDQRSDGRAGADRLAVQIITAMLLLAACVMLTKVASAQSAHGQTSQPPSGTVPAPASNLYLPQIVQSKSGGAWSPACEASVTADFTARDALPQTNLPKSQWNLPTVGSWGPDPAVYPRAAAPTGCDPLRWRQERVLAVIDKLVKLDINYCHHHIPAWTASPAYQTDANCSPAKQSGPHWQGLDCSNFTSWVYNYGFGGFHLTGDIVDQSGQVTSPQPQWPNDAASASKSTAGTLLKDANGQYLSVGNNNLEANLATLRPGDLLYLAGNQKKGSTQATEVTHVVLWTGYKVRDLGLSKIAAPWQQYAQPDDWVIVDSHYAGPAYRPLHGPFEIDVNDPSHVLGCKQWPGDCYKYSDLVWGVRRIQ